MKVRIGLVVNDNISMVEELTENLESAVETGEMDLVDNTSAALMNLIEEDNSVDLDEAVWKKLNEIVRSHIKTYSADYIIDRDIAEFLILNAGSFLDSKLREILVQSVESDAFVVQIPFDAELSDA